VGSHFGADLQSEDNLEIDWQYLLPINSKPLILSFRADTREEHYRFSTDLSYDTGRNLNPKLQNIKKSVKKLRELLRPPSRNDVPCANYELFGNDTDLHVNENETIMP